MSRIRPTGLQTNSLAANGLASQRPAANMYTDSTEWHLSRNSPQQKYPHVEGTTQDVHEETKPHTNARQDDTYPV